MKRAKPFRRKTLLDGFRRSRTSVERLEVRLETANPGRYIVSCNQRPVPLKPSTSVPGWINGPLV